MAWSDISSGQQLFILMFLAIGGLFASVGVFVLVQNLLLLGRGVRGDAIVAGYETRESSDSDGRSYFFHPILEFTDLEGRRQHVVPDEATGSQPYAEGCSVKILYLPGDPQMARICTFQGMWLGVMVPLGFGLTFIGIAAVVWSAIARSG